jgi:hypothetical protein
MANQIEPPKVISGLMASLMGFIRRGPKDPDIKPQDAPTLKIARYSLVLLDCDGQVAWTREWDVGDAFNFGPRWCLWVFCEFTNRSNREVEIVEYEIELMSDEGLVVERFGNAFADSLMIAPGETRVFSGKWRL